MTMTHVQLAAPPTFTVVEGKALDVQFRGAPDAV